VAAALGLDPATDLQPGRKPDPPASLRITGVCLDSRAIRPGDLYAALPGQRTHGARFVSAAAERGAVAVLTDPAGVELAEAAGLPVLAVDDPRAALGALAAWLFGEPARQMLMLAVTGTNGKTTTTFLMDGALRRGGGRRCGLVGTVETRIVDRRLPSVRTTPEAPDLQALLALMVAEGADACSMEVSSHALALGRVDGIQFDVAGFTNLSQDHLDFHATMAEYFAAKAELFTPARARVGVVCVDDEWGRRLADSATIPIVTVATRPGAGPADWRVSQPRPDGIGTSFTLRGPNGSVVAARCPLPGDFNVANTALALVMLVATGIAAETAADWLAQADPVPGRMEQIGGTQVAGEPLAIVDYAHTPDAVEAALRTLRGARPGRLVVVLGAGGDRDRAKRPLMGQAAAREADVVIVTDDNPRSEDPAAIRAAVLAGTVSSGASGPTVIEVADRRAAVLEGVRQAWDGGTLLVAGKGHESGQEIAGVVHPFDDRDVVRQALHEFAALGDQPGRRPATQPAGQTEETEQTEADA
jgi:UDP-N-acetylmuramoyl-L-alanyl-D-glutamate--2,6-diaminopimelate ligase